MTLAADASVAVPLVVAQHAAGATLATRDSRAQGTYARIGVDVALVVDI